MAEQVDNRSSQSTEQQQRLFAKRAREIQAEEGVPTSFWVPSCVSKKASPDRLSPPEEVMHRLQQTPETIPSSSIAAISGSEVARYRRARAGTVPSRFSPGDAGKMTLPGSSIYSTASSSPPPETDLSSVINDYTGSNMESPTSISARLRAGSLTLPNRNAYSSAFGPSIFSSSWAHRINSQQLPSSPAHSSFSKDEEQQTPIKTLDYLGLADTPTPPRTFGHLPKFAPQASTMSSSSYLPDSPVLRRDANRIRSYSVSAKEKYETEYHDDYTSPSQDHLTSTYSYNTIVHRNAQSPSRPRSRTAGILDSPPSTRSNKYLPMQSHMENSITAADMHKGIEEQLTTPVSGTRVNQERYEDHVTGNIMQSQPTRALWLGNIPSTTPSSALLNMFAPFGPIESARVLTHKSCAFVNFEMMDSAVRARSSLHGKELFPGGGPIRIGFAKAPLFLSSSSPEPHLLTDLVGGRIVSCDLAANDILVSPLEELETELLSLVSEYGASALELENAKALIKRATENARLFRDVPAGIEPVLNRRFDAPRLREIRKRIDNGGWSQDELEDTAGDMLDELAELSSDYLGNTVVQKLFEYCSESVKETMLEHIGQHMPEIGVHKNGTWAAQKIIDTANTPKQMQLIVDHIQPFVPSLFLDQFGNYVIQCCLRFGATYNDCIFQAMVSRTWEIAQGRFGARAMRACLESHHTTKEQQRILAAAITLHSVLLATNPNGALLITWLLDTCMQPNRHRLLASKLLPYLSQLCTHKLASLTILKVVNQRQEPDARDIIVQKLFCSEGDTVLEEVLRDQIHGATVIFKILTTPYLDSDNRVKMLVTVRRVLARLKIHPANGYKRLMDEVGLSSRATTEVSTLSQPGAIASPLARSYSSHAPGREYAPPYFTLSQTATLGQQVDPNLTMLPRSAATSNATLHALEELTLQIGHPTYNPISPQQVHQIQQQMQYETMLQQTFRMPPQYNLGFTSQAPQYHDQFSRQMNPRLSQQFVNSTGYAYPLQIYQPPNQPTNLRRSQR